VILFLQKGQIILLWFLELEKMKDENKTKEQLVNELKELREWISELEVLGNKTSKDLAKSEALYRQLVENPLIGVWQVDPKGRLIFINKQLAKMSGYSQDEAIGISMLAAIPQQLRPWIAERMEKRMAGELPPDVVETEIVRKDGARRTVLATPAVIYDDAGKAIGLIGAVLDITERKLTEDALRESEGKYRQLFETVSDAIILFDADTQKFIDFNDAALSLYGYSKKEFLKLRLSDITAEQEESAESIKQLIAGKIIKIPLRWHKHKNGTIFPTEISSGIFKMGNRQIACGVLRDISDRKRAEEALRDSEERYRALADAAFEAIFISENGICTNTNQAATEMFGYKHDELIGIFGADVIAPESKELVKHNMLSGHEKPYEVVAQRKDGTTFHTEIRGKMTRYKGKDVRITVVNDVDDRKRAEETLRQAHDELEMKVERRTYELVKANERLKNEIEDHRRTELALKERRKELENKTHELEEVNAALKVLLKQRDEDKKELEEKVVANVKTLVFPYVEKLNKSLLNDQQAVYLDIVKSNLEDVLAPFLNQLSSKYFDLTPKEIQIAGLVKDGKTTKEISEFLNSTTGAVDFHRNNLRKKLGLRNTKTNLRSFLLSFP
jgi:PAS domain S-box-containing protein